jgi:nucleotide-binding universal stress UspA family protein
MDSVSTETAPLLEGSATFRRVLVASALDDAGRLALRRAVRLPLARGARLEILHVRAPWPSGRRASEPEARRSLEDALAEAGEDARDVGRPELQFVTSVADGWPAREIVRAAWRGRAELIVVGPPATRFDRSPRATVARVVRWADLPVLVVRREPSGEYRRVLCAVDRTITAAGTVELASRLAPSRPLTLFHAYHVPFQNWLGPAPEIEAEVLEYLGALARELAPVAPVDRVIVRRGDRCVEVIRAAEAERADLVVVGTRGRAGLARSLSASAAQWVLACAPLDVAVARRHGLALPRE